MENVVDEKVLWDPKKWDLIPQLKISSILMIKK